MSVLWLVLLGALLLPGTFSVMRDMVGFHRNPPEDPFLRRLGWAGTIIFVLFVGGCLLGIALG